MGAGSSKGAQERGQKQFRPTAQEPDAQLEGQGVSGKREHEMPNMDKIMDTVKGEAEVDHARSGGPGGQGVNKTNSQAILKWNFWGSEALNVEQKTRLFQKLDGSKRLNNAGEIVIHSQNHRSWHRNREEAFTRLRGIIEEGLTPEKKRKETKPSRGAQRRRMDEKTKQGEKKRSRSEGKRIDRSDW
jgi:ribosome-associated protein